MFTGLVSAVGRIREAHALPGAGAGKRVSVLVPAGWLHGASSGDSICVSGACMTAVELGPEHFAFDISAESLARTAGLDQVGSLVNLEQSLTLATKLGGHLVTGHVDAVGTVERFDQVGESHHLQLGVPRALCALVAVKGSLTVNGVSLTVNQVDDHADGSSSVHINLIPHTLAHTNLHRLSQGASVNLEVDLIARYVRRMLDHDATDSQLLA